MPLDDLRTRPWNWRYPTDADRLRTDYFGLASSATSQWDSANRVPLARYPPPTSSGREHTFIQPTLTQVKEPRGLGASMVPIRPYQSRQMGANVEGIQLFDRSGWVGNGHFQIGHNYAPVNTGTQYTPYIR